MRKGNIFTGVLTLIGVLLIASPVYAACTAPATECPGFGINRTLAVGGQCGFWVNDVPVGIAGSDINVFVWQVGNYDPATGAGCDNGADTDPTSPIGPMWIGTGGDDAGGDGTSGDDWRPGCSGCAAAEWTNAAWDGCPDDGAGGDPIGSSAGLLMVWQEDSGLANGPDMFPTVNATYYAMATAPYDDAAGDIYDFRNITTNSDGSAPAVADQLTGGGAPCTNERSVRRRIMPRVDIVAASAVPANQNADQDGDFVEDYMVDITFEEIVVAHSNVAPISSSCPISGYRIFSNSGADLGHLTSRAAGGFTALTDAKGGLFDGATLRWDGAANGAAPTCGGAGSVQSGRILLPYNAGAANNEFQWVQMCPIVDDGNGPMPCNFVSADSLQLRAGNPVSATLDDFTASSNGKGEYDIDWSTLNEAGVVGFNLYRHGPKGDLHKINQSLIEASGSADGNDYGLIDHFRARGDVTYVLEIVNEDGSIERFEVTVSNERRITPKDNDSTRPSRGRSR